MELEQRVLQHDETLRFHSEEISNIKSEMKTMNQSISESLARVDESNKFLREQNTRQSEQNAQILKAVLDRNEGTEVRQHELAKMKANSIIKISLALFGSGGLVYMVIDLLLKYAVK